MSLRRRLVALPRKYAQPSQAFTFGKTQFQDWCHRDSIPWEWIAFGDRVNLQGIIPAIYYFSREYKGGGPHHQA